MVWQEAACEHPLVIARAKQFWPGAAEIIVEAEKECGLYKKKPVRTYKPNPKQNAFTSFKYE